MFQMATKSRLKTTPAGAKKSPAPRQRLSTAERERQIVDSAIQFFTERGLDGQTRDLAQQIGITHPLLYHYFPSKRDLIERVYQEVYLDRWKPEWESMLDDRTMTLQDRLTRFYTDYATTILTKDWVRILLYSALSDGFIPGKYMGLLSEKLFPRIVRETRHHLGLRRRSAPTEAERELVWGLHGGVFYIGIRRWLYNLEMPEDLPATLADRVRAYMLAAPEVHARASAQGAAAGPKEKARVSR